jgi:hypothetical protein
MWKSKPPFRLILNSAAAKEIEWHVKHYMGRGVMKKIDNGVALAKEIGVSPDVLKKTFAEYNEVAKKSTDPYGKKFFNNTPFEMNDTFYSRYGFLPSSEK